VITQPTDAFVLYAYALFCFRFLLRCATTTFYGCTYHEANEESDNGGFYIREEAPGAPDVFYPFDSDTGIPLANIPSGGNRITVTSNDLPTLSCRQGSVALQAGTYRVTTSSSSYVDSPYDDFYLEGTFDVGVGEGSDVDPPEKIFCPSSISGLGDDGCYLTDFTRIPVFEDCSAITLSQSGTVATPGVITVTATDSSQNVGETCEMTITGTPAPGCLDPCPDLAVRVNGVCSCPGGGERDSAGNCPCEFDYLRTPGGACAYPPDTGSACSYAILAKSGISTVPTSTVTGNIGVSPIAATAITGFSLSLAVGGQSATSTQVVGEAHAASYGGAIAADLTQAVLDMQAAYTALAALATTPGYSEFNAGDLSGLTLLPGVYTFTTNVNINTDLTFNGGANDVFVIQTTGIVTIASAKKIILAGGAQAKNIFWQVAGDVAIGTDAEFKGMIHCFTKVVLFTGSSLEGNIYSQTAVTLQKATVDAETCTEEVPTVDEIVQPKVDLKAACNYAVLAKSGISTVPTSTVTGNIGVSPIAATAITGFDLVLAGNGQSATSTQVVGEAHGASYGNPIADTLTIAVLDMQAAYLDAASRNHKDATRTNVRNGAIGGLNLLPGVYTFTVAIAISQDVTLTGGPNDVFIFQTTGQLLQAADTNVILSGVKAENVFWQVAGNAAIGARASMQGILLVKTDVVFITGSSLVGSILAQTAVALQMATITKPDSTCNVSVVSNRNLRIRD
jgi:hypothetical protein